MWTNCRGGLKFINITGGEPFLRDDLDEIVRVALTKTKRLVISSNGYYTDKMVDLAKKFPNIGVRISIEGLPEANDRLRVIAGEGDFTGVLNAGSGKGVSVSNIIEQLKDVTGRQPSVSYEPGRAFDVKEIVLDISRTKTITGWHPIVDFADGLKQHWEWYSSLPQH